MPLLYSAVAVPMNKAIWKIFVCLVIENVTGIQRAGTKHNMTRETRTRAMAVQSSFVEFDGQQQAQAAPLTHIDDDVLTLASPALPPPPPAGAPPRDASVIPTPQLDADPIPSIAEARDPGVDKARCVIS